MKNRVHIHVKNNLTHNEPIYNCLFSKEFVYKLHLESENTGMVVL